MLGESVEKKKNLNRKMSSRNCLREGQPSAMAALGGWEAKREKKSI